MPGHFLETGEGKKAGARVLLAMSGGVDSAGSAVMLQRAGFNVIGLTMKNYCYGEVDVPDRSCCSIEAIDDARDVCDRLNIPHRVTNTEEVFGREVYDNFLTEYAEARTPNPCVRCNSIVRFSTLESVADEMGIDYYATGHYARTFRSDAGRLYLGRPRHLPKDQSYFLSGLSHADLERVIFPLGDFEKKEVRETARAASLTVAEKPESQEVCFIPDGTLRDFLQGRIPLTPGQIENTSGEVLGEHEGLNTYTVGQRRGLGVSAGRPQYVVRLDRARNVLVVGEDEDLFTRDLVCRVNWVDSDALMSVDGVSAQIRSRHGAEPLSEVSIDGDLARVTFAEAQRAIAPGQTIAFYRGDVVVGSGVIE
jgi:tRNA-specific 2-thiouridylase